MIQLYMLQLRLKLKIFSLQIILMLHQASKNFYFVLNGIKKLQFQRFVYIYEKNNSSWIEAYHILPYFFLTIVVNISKRRLCLSFYVQSWNRLLMYTNSLWKTCVKIKNCEILYFIIIRPYFMFCEIFNTKSVSHLTQFI